MKLQDVLFEIGTEELPATNLADIFETPGVNPLEARLRKILEENRIVFDSCAVWATPRRLIFWVRRAAPLQAPKDTLTRLMARQEAFDPAGAPTEKFLNILKHRRASAKDTITADHGGREFVFLKKKEPVRQTRAVLPEICGALVKTLPFPKTMRWDAAGLHFPRPIRNLLCLYGSRPVAFKLGHLTAGNRTLVFAHAERKSFRVKDVESYFSLLKRQGIIADPAERRRAIRRQLDHEARSVKALVHPDEFLLNEVIFLVENPRALTASFRPEFLKLPPEVLTVSMARQQRIFGTVDARGRLLPRFIGVTDGLVDKTDRREVSRHYENILQAKLQDSLFFYQEDTKTKLADKQHGLKGLVFLRQAGSMWDKSNRLVGLAKDFQGVWNLPRGDQEALQRAAALSKADLLTHMVGEFPELQGTMGRYYAIADGEQESVGLAIGEQYLPRTVNDALPATSPGAILSLLDKADLIVACYRLGQEPSSSLDPYALRRSGNAVVRIALNKQLRFSIRDLIGKIIQLQIIENPKNNEATTMDKLCGNAGFFWDRFRASIVGPNLGGDVVDAVTTVRCDDFVEVHERAIQLQAFRAEPCFPQACKVIERFVNILKGNKETLAPEPDPAVFKEDLEHSLHRQYLQSREAIRDAARARNFRQATSLYAGAFFDILGEFFEKVFVNDSDPNVRKNRLSLLKAVKDLYTEDIADLSKIDPEQKTPIQKGNS